MANMPTATARALILAIKFIEGRDSLMTEDDDLQALEEISAELAVASSEEKECLVKAAVDFNVPDFPEQLGLLDE